MTKKFLGWAVGITMVCCFTPVLVILVAALGIGWVTGYLDYVLTPLLGFFTSALVFVLHKFHKRNKLVFPIGGVFFFGFVVQYSIWDPTLGVLVFLGGIAGYYAAIHKR